MTHIRELRALTTDGPFTADDFLDMDWENDEPVRTSAAEQANKRYLELHPPVSEGMRFMAEDFIEYTYTGEGRCLKVLSPNGMAEKANAKLQRILAQGVRVLNTEPGVYIKDDINPNGIVINIEEVKP